jgi:hypothetical protein
MIGRHRSSGRGSVPGPPGAPRPGCRRDGKKEKDSLGGVGLPTEACRAGVHSKRRRAVPLRGRCGWFRVLPPLRGTTFAGLLACQPKLAEEQREGSGGERRLGWVTGFEPATSGATVRRSTAELYPPQMGQHTIIASALGSGLSALGAANERSARRLARLQAFGCGLRAAPRAKSPEPRAVSVTPSASHPVPASSIPSPSRRRPWCRRTDRC